MKSYIRN